MNRQTKKKSAIFAELQEAQFCQIPPQIKKYIDKTVSQNFNIDQRFRNLQDPLKFIHNSKIGSLIAKTQQTKNLLHKQMEQISQFSKTTYKKVVSRQNNEYDFDKLYNFKQGTDYELIFNISQKHKREKLKENTSTEIKKKQLKKEFKHRIGDSQNVYQSIEKQQLNFSHIKMIDTQQFDRTCKNVQFYDLLKSQKQQKHMLYNQAFDINSNLVVDEAVDKLVNFKFIQSSQLFGKQSQYFMFDCDNNLKFWKQQAQTPGVNKLIVPRSNQVKTEQQILSKCIQFDKHEPSALNVLDFAIRKINCQDLTAFYDLKLQHQYKHQINKKNQNLDEKYAELKKEFQFARDNRLNSKANRIAPKHKNTECQTTDNLEDQEFDEYFNDDTKKIFQRLIKLNQTRQKVITTEQGQTKLIMLTNIIEQVKQQLFCLLILTLKGQNFHHKLKQAPIFTYPHLLSAQSRQQVQRTVLELIYKQFTNFKVKQIDGIAKADMIKIYLNQREKYQNFLELLKQKQG